MNREGLMIIHKPVGVTSFSIVSLIRRVTGVRRVGHAGTLDPLASGVLPVAVGAATRLIEYLDDELKTYVARMGFGIETDTYDAEGAVTGDADASWLTPRDVAAALEEFVGDIAQTPPRFSALKVAGKPLYRYAREGVEVGIATRTVHIESIVLLDMADGIADIEVRCGKGTYIRSLAHDLGVRLGCGAHLAGLVRTSSGGFELTDAVTPEEIAARAADGRLEDVLLAVDRAVETRPALILGAPRAEDVRCGRTFAIGAARPAELCRAYSIEGDFLGVVEAAGEGLWHPEKVFAPANIARSG